MGNHFSCVLTSFFLFLFFSFCSFLSAASSYAFFPAQIVRPEEIDTSAGEFEVPETVLAAGHRLRVAEEDRVAKLQAASSLVSPHHSSPLSGVVGANGESGDENDDDDGGRGGSESKKKRTGNGNGQNRNKAAVVQRKWLVRFYDVQRSWAWVDVKGLALLGEDKGSSSKKHQERKGVFVLRFSSWLYRLVDRIAFLTFHLSNFL